MKELQPSEALKRIMQLSNVKHKRILSATMRKYVTGLNCVAVIRNTF